MNFCRFPAVVFSSLVLLTSFGVHAAEDEYGLPGASIYLEAREAETSGRYGTAHAAYRRCAEEDPILAPYALARAAVCAIRSTRSDETFASFDRFLEGQPHGPWTWMAQSEAGFLLASRERYEAAARHYAGVVQAPYKPWWFHRHDWRAAEVFIEVPETAPMGFAHFRELVETTNTRSIRMDAAEQLLKSPDLNDRVAALLGYVQSNANSEAQAAFRDMREQLAEAQWRETGAYLTGLMQMVQGNRDAGRNVMREAMEHYPEAGWAPRILLQFLRALINGGENDLAHDIADHLRRFFPDSDQAGSAVWTLARHHQQGGRTQRALSYYEYLADVFPNHHRAGDALFEAGQLRKNNGQTGPALEIFARLLAEHPLNSNTVEAMWLSGQLREDEGDTEGAIRDYWEAARAGVGNFLGHRAAHRLEALGATNSYPGNPRETAPGQPVVRPVGGKPLGPDPVDVSNLEDPRLKRLMFFGHHGLKEAEWEAVGLFPDLEAGRDTEHIFHVMGEAGIAYTAMQMAHALDWGIGNPHPTASRWRVRYPRAYWPMVKDIADETGLDPYLILAVARQESTYRPALTSHAGAEGLMQVMPSTAQWMADVESNISRDVLANLHHPGNSLRLGAYYIRRMLNQSGGNMVFAIASYNAGPGNVNRWRNRWPNASMDEFMDNIPFAETNNFVRRVLANYAAYHSLYPPAE